MKKLWIAVLSGWLVTLGAGIAQAQSGYDLFQKALAKERAEGNIQEAIQFYQRIVREHATNRTLTAKALVQMGQCYEKLGKAEARRAYERVLKEYADQPEQASEARARLAALSPPPNRTNGSAMLARRIWAGQDVDVLGQPSPDGRFLTYTDWETGDLAVRDLGTGEKRRLTKKGTWFESIEFALFSIISPDSRLVAYDWFNAENFFDLRILPLEAGSPAQARVLYRNAEVEYVQPFEWSADGKQILAAFSRTDRTNQIVLISTADGSVRTLKTLDWRYPQKMSLSPDGRYIAYDFPPKEEAAERDILLLAADGSGEIRLIEHPANDLFPTWTPDGKRLLFASDRTGNICLWGIQVAQGKPQGAPELVKGDIGRLYPMGFTRKGSYYYGLSTGMRDVYLATLDLATGKVLAPPAPASQRFMGSNYSPDWSPDGRQLVFVSQRGLVRRGPGSTILVIRSLQSGEERELTPKLDRVQRPRWFPDGRSLLVMGRDTKGRDGFYRLDAASGEATLLIPVQPGVNSNLGEPELSSDSRRIFYRRGDRKVSSIVVRDMEDGSDTELHRVALPAFIQKLALSPDDSRLAIIVGDPNSRSTALKIVPVRGGESLELVRLQPPEDFQTVAWSPDGKAVLFGKADSPNYQKQTVWAVSAEGGKAQKLDLTVDRLRAIRFHPDGRRIALDAGQNIAEVWVMENFLPVLRAAK